MDQIKIIHSSRKTISIEITPLEEIIVRAPFWVSKKRIGVILQDKKEWISKKLCQIRENPPKAEPDQEKRKCMRKRVQALIRDRLPYWENLTGFYSKGFKITSARKRYGSCSSKGTLCFSLFLDEVHPDLIDYVILHELCHLREMNHSPKFYELVATFMPDWKAREKRLKAFRR